MKTLTFDTRLYLENVQQMASDTLSSGKDALN